MYKIIGSALGMIYFSYLVFFAKLNISTFSNVVLYLAWLGTIYSTYINIKVFYKEKNLNL
ncbi:Uncharacterised protein [uncultured Clostridium sp.]|nr:Uncharacterised protein [uncultured Clostridium sp.]SCI82599.1 Uncharacterised protein [uncultured Clostridium sp.]